MEKIQGKLFSFMSGSSECSSALTTETNCLTLPATYKVENLFIFYLNFRDLKFNIGCLTPLIWLLVRVADGGPAWWEHVWKTMVTYKIGEEKAHP